MEGCGVKVLVCGSRDYSDRETLFRVLDKLAAVVEVTTIIEGGATGADTLAYDWARARGVACQTFPANRKAHGKAAGALRNRQMLDEGKPDLVVAFPAASSVGTFHMIKIADEAGVTVLVMPFDEERIDALGEGVFA